MNIKSRWEFIWPYLVFVLTIVSLVSINAILISSTIREHKTYARTINLAGRQRMLSQKIITDLIFVAVSNKHQQQLNDELELWNSMHHALQNGDGTKGLMRLDDNSILSLFREINPGQQKLYLETKKVLDSINKPVSVKAAAALPLVNRIELLQKSYLAQMDKIVFAADVYVQQKLTTTSNNQLLVSILSGIILLLEILFIVYPYHQRVNKAYEKIKQQNLEIEDQKEKIVEQMDTMSAQNIALENLHKTQKLTIAGINAGVWDWDMITGSQQWSSIFYKLLGFEDGEIPATYTYFLNNLLHPDERYKLEEAIKDHIEHDQLYRLNIRMLQKNGSYRWYETSGKVLRNDNGEAVRMAGSIIDINDKVIYEQQLEISNTTKDKLLAIIAHDLRSPLRSLQALVDLHREDYISEEEFIQSMQKIKTTVGNLSASLDNILHWAMSQIGGFVINPQNINVAEVFELVNNLLINTANDKKITIRSGLNENSLAYIDQNHLFLIIRNLISNAIKYTPAGGTISVTDVIDGDMLKITVTDNGKGMTPAQIEKILENNQILSTPGTQNEIGSGLGLLITLDMLKQNNGKVEVISELNSGSSFIISIPVSKKVNKLTYELV